MGARVALLYSIFAENERLMREGPKGTREEPAVVESLKSLRAVESYGADHLHDMNGNCLKNKWWREDGFCHQKE